VKIKTYVIESLILKIITKGNIKYKQFKYNLTTLNKLHVLAKHMNVFCLTYYRTSSMLIIGLYQGINKLLDNYDLCFMQDSIPITMQNGCSFLGQKVHFKVFRVLSLKVQELQISEGNRTMWKISFM